MPKTHSWEDKLKAGKEFEDKIKEYFEERGVEVTVVSLDEQRRGVDFPADQDE